MSSSSQLDEENSESQLDKAWMQLKIEQYKLKKDEETWQIQRRMEEVLDKKLEEQDTAFKRKYKNLEEEFEKLKNHYTDELFTLKKMYHNREMELRSEQSEHLEKIHGEFDNKLEKIRGIYYEKEEEMQYEFDRRQQRLRQEMYKQEHITNLRTQEHFDIIQRTHLTTVEKLVTNIDELIMKNTEFKMKTNRNHKGEDVKSDPKPNESSDTRFHVTAHGRSVLQEIKKQFLGAKKHDFGYVLLNFMRVEGNIKSMKVYLGNQLIGIHQYTKKKLGLTSKMRKKEPNAIQWHKNNAKTNLESIKREMKFIGWDVEAIYLNKDLCIHLIFLAYHVFSFQYSNQELALSGNPSFLLERDFPEVQNFDIIEWIFQFFVALEEKDFLDRIEYYKTTAKEYSNKFNILELTDPLATD